MQRQIFIERTTQLNELTAQVQVNLDRALDVHWNYLDAAVRLLDGRSFQTVEDVAESIGELEQTLGTENYHSRLILLGSRGNCFDSGGRRGIWSNIDQLFKGKGRYSFLSDSLIYEGSHWAFVQRLDAPLQLEEGNVSFIYAILLKDIDAINRYYNSAAYGNQNETYILKSNGTRIHDDHAQQNSIQAYNVLKALEEMENQSIPDLRAALEETNPRLEETFEIAEEANRAKSAFLSSMSHDICTPMNAIVGFATLLVWCGTRKTRTRYGSIPGRSQPPASTCWG